MALKALGNLLTTVEDCNDDHLKELAEKIYKEIGL